MLNDNRKLFSSDVVGQKKRDENESLDLLL